jgi:DNA-binding transcriptional regulator YdaS (Cro superfamily)
MSTEKEIVGLITRAAATTGSEYKLATVLGIPQSHISMWKSGVRSCSPEDRARMAALANEDAVQELVRATLEKHQGTKKGDQLFAILGKSLRVTGGASVSALVGLVSAAFLMMTTPAPAKAASYDV